MRKQTTSLAALAVVAAVSGCSSMAGDNTQAASNGSATSMVELQAAKRRVSQLESELADRERSLSRTQAQLEQGQQAQHSMASMSGDAGLFPPNPKPGQCYARVLLPAEYRTTTEQLQTRDAAERIEIIPATYDTVQETILVKEAATRLEVVPAVYETIKEQVLVRPATTKLVEVPAEYRNETEQVVDQPAHTAWKKGAPAIQTASVLSQKTTDTGEVMCLVAVPATYKTVQKRVLVRPARTEKVEIPAEYKTVAKTVLKKPATAREITIPAEYDTVQVTRLVSPAREKRIAVPASFETVARTEKVGAEKMEWRQVMCDVNLTQPNVRALQQALKDKGYYKASVDGIFGPQTLGAAQSYAANNGLPAGSNYIPMDVIEELGLTP